MRRRILEWSWIISLLLLIGLTVFWPDSLLAKRRYCFVTGEVTFPPSPGMGPHAIGYAELTIPGLSYHRHHESQLTAAPWSLELTLLIPVVLLLVILGLSWSRLRKRRRPPRPSPLTSACLDP